MVCLHGVFVWHRGMGHRLVSCGGFICHPSETTVLTLHLAWLCGYVRVAS